VNSETCVFLDAPVHNQSFLANIELVVYRRKERTLGRISHALAVNQDELSFICLQAVLCVGPVASSH
jgi:hypothetical protein